MPLLRVDFYQPGLSLLMSWSHFKHHIAHGRRYCSLKCLVKSLVSSAGPLIRPCPGPLDLRPVLCEPLNSPASFLQDTCRLPLVRGISPLPLPQDSPLPGSRISPRTDLTLKVGLNPATVRTPPSYSPLFTCMAYELFPFLQNILPFTPSSPKLVNSQVQYDEFCGRVGSGCSGGSRRR